MVDTKNTITAHNTKIPLDWKVTKLGDVGKIRMCKRIFNHETNEKGDIPFFKIGTFGKEPDAFIPKELYDNYRKKFSFPKKGEILISAAGTLGRTVVYDGSPAYFQDSNIVWIDNSELIVTNQYLYYVYQIVKYESEGGTIQRLYNSIISNAEFICPPLPEQKAIAQVLSTADAAVQTTEKLIAQKELRKKWLMQQLLSGKQRLNGFGGEWKSEILGNVVSLQHGYQFRDEDFVEEGIPVIKIRNVIGYDLVLTDMTFVDESRLDEFKSVIIENGDLLMSLTGNIGRVVEVKGVDKPMFQNYRVGKFTPIDGQLTKSFLKFILSSDILFKQFNGLANQSAQANFGKQDMDKLKFSFPISIEEQTTIAQVLQTVDKEISLLHAKAEKLREQKKGLMQQLLTGKVRLKIN